VLQGREGLRLDLERQKEDRSIFYYLQYPTRYRYKYNATQEVYIRLNRCVRTRARERRGGAIPTSPSVAVC
jgi:hypothetical protein